MHENKYDILLKVSVAVLVISATLLVVTGYNVFFRSKGQSHVAAVATPAINTRDSLRLIYNSMVRGIDSSIRISAAAEDSDAHQQFNDMVGLRHQIDSLLRLQGSAEDLAVATFKIEELQQKVAALQNNYSDVALENKKLQLLINRFLAGEKMPNGSADEISNTGHAAPQISLPGKPASSSAGGKAIAAAVHLFAVTDAESHEQETSDVIAADKIVGSFILKNSSAKAGNEVIVVVMQPDGDVIKNSVWDAGTFETKEGKKIYTRKMYLQPPEEKQFNFSLTPDRFMKGEYTLEVWYNGKLVGRAVKTLS